VRERSRLLRKIISLQREESLVPPESSLLIAFSGGIDSVVLTHALLQLRGFLRLRRVALAHFNHMLRKESEEEERFAEEFARSLNLQLFTGREDVGRVARRRRRNLEETARELRYAFLRRVKEKEGFDLIATAHHLNDLVETTLIWLVRGAGLEGLLGFDPREGDVVRPLYKVARMEIEEYARFHSLRWIEDPSNRDPRFFRNRIRLQVIPILKETNPSLEETLLRTREILKAENDLLHRLSLETFRKVKEGECIRAGELAKEHTAIQRRVLAMFADVRSFRKVEQLRRLLSRGGEVNLGEGLRAVRRGGLICLKKDTGKPIF